MTSKWFNRIIIILFSALFVLGSFIIDILQIEAVQEQNIIDWGDKPNFAGLEVIEQSQYDMIKAMYEPGLKLPKLTYGKYPAAYDDNTNTLYISTVDNPNCVADMLLADDPEVNAFILENEYRNYPDIIAREAAKFNVIFVKYDKYVEATLIFTNNRLEILNSEKQTITINDNSGTVTLKNGKEKIKYYQIDTEDKTFSREIISLKLWNSICDESAQKEFEICELFLDDTACGLYIKTEKEGDSSDIAAYIDKMDKDSLADYILLTQIVFAYKNAEEHFRLIQNGDKYCIKPGRIKYSLGTYSNSKKYLEYNVFDRKIGLAEFGIEDKAIGLEIDELVKEKYIERRDNNLSDEKLKGLFADVLSWTDNSGYVARCGSFDEFRQAREELYDFLDDRLQGLDKQYGLLKADAAKEIDYSKIYLQFADQKLLRACLYHDAAGFVFYIPTFYNSKEADIYISNDRYELSIDGELIDHQGSVGIDNNKHTIKLFDKETGISISDELLYLKSAKLATVFIDTANGTTDYIATKIRGKEEIKSEPGTYICYDEYGNIDSNGELKKIRCRGNSSFIEGDKLSFQLNFNEPLSVLGMDSAYKWVLQGNTLDSTRIRNSIMYYYAKELGMEAYMQNQFADVYINGEYQGNYLVCEKPETASGRVEIDEDGFLVSVINQQRLRTFDCGIEADDIYYRLFYSKDFPSREEKNRVADIIEEASQQLNAGNTGGFEAVAAKINIDSFADMYLLNMLANERDANKFSTYYYYKNSLLNAGPAWDYDRAFKNNGKNMEEQHYKNDYPDGLPEKCFAFTEYQDIVTKKWNESLRPTVEASKLENGEINSLIGSIKPSIVLDYRRNKGIASKEEALNEYDRAVAFMIDAMDERVELIDEVLSDQSAFTKEHDIENQVTYWIKND